MVFLVRGDEVQCAVFVRGVVVGHEALRPCLGFANCCEAVGRVAGMVLGGAEEGFGEGVVVADPGPGVGGGDLKLVHETKDGGRFEGAAIVSMEDERSVLDGDVFAEMSAF